MPGQRVHERHARRIDVTIVHEGQQYAGVSRNISLGGVFVFTELKLPFGAEVEVRLQLPALSEETRITATVRWQQDDGMGMQFGALRARDVWAFNQLFRQPHE